MPAMPPAVTPGRLTEVEMMSATHPLIEKQLAIWRAETSGRFQFFLLLPTLTALENAMLPLDFARRGSERRPARDGQARPRAGWARRQARPSR